MFDRDFAQNEFFPLTVTIIIQEYNLFFATSQSNQFCIRYIIDMVHLLPTHPKSKLINNQH